MSHRFESAAVVPVFPLPDTVFFPRTYLHLHIFEERYRSMVKDVTAENGNRLICVALMAPGGFHEIATVGRVEHLEKLPDGRSNIRLSGLTRVRLFELPSDKPYRLARAEPLPELPYDNDDPAVERAKMELLAFYGYLVRELSESPPPSIVVDQDLPFDVTVNRACAGLLCGAMPRQELLEEDDMLERQRRVSAQLQRQLETLHRATASSDDRPQDLELN